MSKPAIAVVALIAIFHVLIMVAEMFAWDAIGGRLLRTDDQEFLNMTRPMAINQGLYNGFLAAGLFWSLLISDEVWQRRIAAFFLVCVTVAGIVGFATVSASIIFVQTIPSLLGMFLISKSRSDS